MIYKLSGTLIMKDGGKVAIDTSGVAYEVSTPMSTYAGLPSVGEKTELYIHFVMREDGIFLYGFSTLEEKSLFLMLITVSKIGPKMGLSILSNVGGNELTAAISSEDADRLSKIPGIGRKTAERIIVELKDKISSSVNPAKVVLPSSIHTDVLSALCNLGYKEADCSKVLASLATEQDFNTLFKKALAKLAG